MQGLNVLLGSVRNVRGSFGQSVEKVIYVAVAHRFYSLGFTRKIKNTDTDTDSVNFVDTVLSATRTTQWFLAPHHLKLSYGASF